jgi:hypothetical protein
MKSIVMFILACLIAFPGYGRSFRVGQIPNGNLNSCSNCHVNPGGGGVRNAFGQLVEREFLDGSNVVWNARLASLDADGDGVTNGQELQDAFGEWISGQQNPGNPALVTHPANEVDNNLRTLTVSFSGMDPNVGQLLGLRVIDKTTGLEVGRQVVDAISSSFDINLPVILDDESYYVQFYADVNGNGGYDGQPTDESWMLEADAINGNTTLNFSRSTSFSDIDWPYVLTLNFSGMTPHVNQLVEVRIVDTSNDLEVGRKRVEIVPGAEFTVRVPGLRKDGSYRADFYADLNGNGHFDGVPNDHSWSENFTNPAGNYTIDFTHNTNFTNIDWEYMFRLNLLGMTPHLGQLLEMRLVDNSDMEIGRTGFESLPVANSALFVPGMMQTADYRTDFYADLNGSGDYNTPPTDHAWREEFSSNGDVVLNFSHNTNFTDIEWPTLAADDPIPFELLPTSVSLFQNYPNPFNPSTSISFNLPQAGVVKLDIFNSLGQNVATLVDGNLAAGLYNREFTGAGLASGVYYYQLRAGEQVLTRRMMLLK